MRKIQRASLGMFSFLLEVNMRPNRHPYTPSVFELVDEIKIYSDNVLYIHFKKYRNKITGEIKSVPVYAL